MIKILPDTVINRIAAGEVVERPSSVVKELVENSLDAGAGDITVEIEQAGSRLIRVTDNGCGMSRADARLAFARHATSKIASDRDLETVRTMGFRGEALSSIASVAQIRLTSAERGSGSGVTIEIEGGVERSLADAAAAPGTILEINHLFFNTPARLKFLKSPATELSHIVTALSRLALAHPSVRFRLIHNKKPLFDLPSSRDVRERLFQLYGAELADNVIVFSTERDPARISGLLGKPGYSRADKTFQEFFVNKRAIRNASLSHALYAAFGDLLMRDRHPAAFLFLDIDPALVDVNVHPAKAEVRFRNQSQIHDLVRDAVREALRGAGSATERDNALGHDGVKEAIAGYLKNSECGIRSAECFSNPGPGGHTADPDQDAPSVHLFDRQSPVPTLNSALLHPLAQVHDSFIVAQSRDGMTLIDQHAAHERVLFERLQDQYADGMISQQNLLLPIQFDVSHAEQLLLEECLPYLQRLGFQVDHFGGGTFVIKAVPALMTGGDYKQLVLDILDEVRAQGASTAFEKRRDEILSVMACHPAIKVHRKLSLREMEDLIRELYRCRMPHSCPHGRPTVIPFSINEIRKMFKRI